MKIIQRIILAALVTSLLPAQDAHAQLDLSLQKALATARANNPDIKASSFAVNIAESNLITARLHTNPILNNQTLFIADSRFYSISHEPLSPYNRQVWWQLTKPFTPPSQRRNRIDLAGENINFSQRAYQDNIRSFSYDVAVQWLDVYMLRNELELLNEASANIDSLVQINRARLRNQVITQTDLMRTQLLQEQYRLQRINAVKELRSASQLLRSILGTTDSIGVDMTSAIETLPVSDNPDSLVAEALRNRPDVAAAESAVRAATINEKYQRSLRIPQPELGMIWNPQNSVPYLGFFGTLRIPLLDRNQGEIEKSKFIELQATQGLTGVRIRLSAEVRGAWQSFTTDRENMKRYEGMLTQADQVLENVRYAYLKGGTTIIDFLDAQRSWFDTRRLLLDARKAYLNSYIKVLYVTGAINQL